VATPVGDIPERLGNVDNCYVREPSPEVFAEALTHALHGGRASDARVAVESLGIATVANRLATIYGKADEIQARRGR
jgi:hypothetical protein